MAISIHHIVTDQRHLTLRVELTEKEDAPLVHALFQDVLSARLGLRLALGTEPEGPDSGSFGFPLGTPFDLTYDAIAREVSLAQGPLSRPEPGWPKPVVTIWPTGPLPNFFDVAFSHRPHR